MYTPPTGSPVMQLYLFTAPSGRDVSGADDAAIVYHEYAHGLTNRLVTTADGVGALNTPQAAAMGEGFSDFFAMDFLVSDSKQVDGPAAGDVDVGEYVNGDTPLRLQAIDCPVGVAAARCGAGGFTYDDFGELYNHPQHGPLPEVHSDGEIWAQTLWDLRAVLADDARQVVYEALQIAPTEPSFLDMRNAILQAGGDEHRDAIWEVFRNRGMGFYASTSGSSDVDPDASDVDPDEATGSISGTVTDFDSGRAIAGAGVRVGGQAFSATTAASGAFTLGPLPAGSYGDVIFSAAGGHDPVTRSLTAPATGVAVQLRRNWAAKASGARIASVAGVVSETAGCTADEAIDQDADTGFSVVHDGSAPAIVVRLPRLVSVAEFAVNPGNTCGDGFEATTTRFAIAVSEDGASWREAPPYTLAANAAHTRTALAPGVAAGRANYVRLRLLATADASPYIDFSELSVYGNALPVVAFSAPASGVVGGALTLSAAGTADPDGTIARYEWDFDGNGTADRVTTTPATTYAYGRAGSFRATVTAVDSKGGRNAAARTIAIAAPPAPPPPPDPPPPSPPRIAAPVVELPTSGTRGRLSLRVTCGVACSGTAKLTVDRRTARKLGLGRTRTVATARVRLTAAGTKRVTVRLTAKARRALERRRVRTLRGRLAVAVTDTGGRSANARRTVRVRR